MTSKDRNKLLLAIILLVIAGLAYAYLSGWFDRAPAAVAPPVQTDANGLPTGGPRTAPAEKGPTG